jgi:excisionase family DNA binding protein
MGVRKGGPNLADELQEWMTIAEAMAYLRVSRATLYRLSADGRLPYFTVGSSRDRRFRRRDLDAALVPAENSPRPGKRPQ